MSQLFAVSDTHFGHGNIIKYESRPFRTVDEMDREIVRRWNKRIAPDDRVIFLGDFCLRNRAYYERMLAQLNYGSMLWIKGNHDRGIKTLNEFPRVFATKRMILPIEGLGNVLLTHEPIDCDNELLDGGVVDINLHGHVHSRGDGDVIVIRHGITYFNVGVDTNRLRPWYVNEIVRECKKFRRSLQ